MTGMAILKKKKKKELTFYFWGRMTIIAQGDCDAQTGRVAKLFYEADSVPVYEPVDGRVHLCAWAEAAAGVFRAAAGPDVPAGHGDQLGAGVSDPRAHRVWPERYPGLLSAPEETSPIQPRYHPNLPIHWITTPGGYRSIGFDWGCLPFLGKRLIIVVGGGGGTFTSTKYT
jgi:hypothetical protein